MTTCCSGGSPSDLRRRFRRGTADDNESRRRGRYGADVVLRSLPSSSSREASYQETAVICRKEIDEATDGRPTFDSEMTAEPRGTATKESKLDRQVNPLGKTKRRHLFARRKEEEEVRLQRSPPVTDRVTENSSKLIIVTLIAIHPPTILI
ncbi:hypothetical protein BHE74_00031496 [Ensete ventricosum]|nr:hypothetical protein BHE74_00031496 [Ensete ventricosum]